MRELAGVVEHLRQSNIRTAEQLERSKNRTESISCRLEETRASLHQIEAKATSKDFLIRTMVDLLLSQIEDSCDENAKSLNVGFTGEKSPQQKQEKSSFIPTALSSF